MLEESTAFLEGELRKRGVVTEEGLKELRRDLLQDTHDIDSSDYANWIPHNFVDGDWKQQPTSF